MSAQEVKGTLAKLLATENLIVEHRVVQTASFDVDRRVLVLPIWDVAERVYNMLVGHEVGHALFTPNAEWKDMPVPKSYINITEDARIEKLMKRKFPGLAKDFFEGYKRLNEDDFFSVAEIDWVDLNLIDRINLYYKIGSYHMIPFNDAETVLRDAVGDTETFEEAMSAAEAIYAYEKAKKEEEKLPSMGGAVDTEDFNQDGSFGDSTGETTSDEGEGDQIEGKGSSDQDPEEDESSDSTESSKKGGTEAGDLESITDQALSDHLKEQAQMNEQDRPKYLEIPFVDLDHHIVSPKRINDLSHEYWGHEQFTDPNYEWHRTLDWTDVDGEYRKFKRECSREVNYLAKEFEMKKAATSYSRESVARTGVLDTSKLHTYKFNEDLFKKITVRPDGKNHGMIFLLDWSGSMADCIHDTYKQLLSLCLFCRKSGIPFDVYAFIQDGNFYPEGWNEREWEEKVKKAGTFHIPSSFFLLNFLNSKLNNQKFDQYARDLFRVTFMYNYRYSYRYRSPWNSTAETTLNVPDALPHHLQLGGTPLNEAVVCLKSLIPSFQSRSKVEKVHVAILSDGEAAYSGEWRETVWNGKTEINRSCIRYNTHIRDRKTGRTYAPSKYGGQGGCTTTNQLLRYLKGRFPQCNFLGFRIASNRDVNRYLDDAFYPKYDKIERYKKEWTKNKSVCVPIMGYQELYFLNNKNLNIDVEFEPKSDSKADIKRAYAKSLKGKANNKKILSSFITQIA